MSVSDLPTQHSRLGVLPSPRPSLSMGERWTQWLAGMVLAALVAYFTTMSAINAQLSELRSTESAHFQEILRGMAAFGADIRELRNQRYQP